MEVTQTPSPGCGVSFQSMLVVDVSAVLSIWTHYFGVYIYCPFLALPSFLPSSSLRPHTPPKHLRRAVRFRIEIPRQFHRACIQRSALPVALPSRVPPTTACPHGATPRCPRPNRTARARTFPCPSSFKSFAASPARAYDNSFSDDVRRVLLADVLSSPSSAPPLTLHFPGPRTRTRHDAVSAAGRPHLRPTSAAFSHCVAHTAVARS